jgi:hypothetical protein
MARKSKTPVGVCPNCQELFYSSGHAKYHVCPGARTQPAAVKEPTP